MTLRRTIVATSLKMYFGHARTLEWVRAAASVAIPDTVETIVLPSFLSIPETVAELRDTPIGVGAQNMWSDDAGAFTGEVSGPQLREAGCRFVELGHAERERLFGEDAGLVAAKIDSAWRNDLCPILCLGEKEEETPDAAARRCAEILRDLLARTTGGGDLIVAYEPVWAIGAPHAASAEHVRTVAAALREVLAQHPALKDARIIYGGAAGEGLLEQLYPAVDGLFLGRFAHDPAAWGRIVEEAAAVAASDR
ncbi:triose-phosphate isomerase family protein [Microbacterium sp. YY-01]|uniref:triose-phosphate isomerase family protein n=1 Tax=Microbacterium sp. YY-01 TaxID=3421634 RepID=UPI003D183AD9